MMNTKYIQISRRRRHTLGNYSMIKKEEEEEEYD